MSRTLLNAFDGSLVGLRALVSETINPFGQQFKTKQELTAFANLVRYTMQDWIDNLYVDSPDLAERLDLQLNPKTRNPEGKN